MRCGTTLTGYIAERKSAKTRSVMGANERLRMDGDKTIGPLALQQLGEALQGGYGIQTRLPFRLHSLVEQLVRMTKEEDYLDNAADAVIGAACVFLVRQDAPVRTC